MDDADTLLPPAKNSRLIKLLTVLVAGGCALLLYFAHEAFVPVALALLFALVLSAPVEALRGFGVRRSLSATLLLGLILGVVIAVANLISEPAQAWFNTAPHTIKIIERKVRPVAQLMARIDSLRNSAGNIGASPRPPGVTPPPPGNADDHAPPILLFDATRSAVVSSATVLILTLFLLAGGPPMLARMASAFASNLKAAHVILVIEKVRREVGRFYATSALINVGLGLCTGLVMMACGLPNPFLWGTVAALFNFIPYAGPTATLLVLTLVAIISFDNLGRVLIVAASFLALATVEGQFVQPLLVGRRLQLNPMLVFLSLWFGGFFWGVAGVVLATPALVALKVIAAHSRGGQPLLEFLSPHADEDETPLAEPSQPVNAANPE